MEFKKCKLGDFIESISDTTPIKKENVILINTSDVEDGKVLNHKYVENKNLKGQFKKRFKINDILYSEIRPKNKRFAYVNFESDDYIASTKLMVLRNKGNINNKYLFQLLKSDHIVNYLQRIAESRSGTFPQITFEELKNIQVNIPNINNQIKIAYFIESIEDKIKLNNQINDNLYELLKTMYKNELISNSENKKLDEYCNIFTGKKNANQYDENGENLFFTCSPNPLKINSFIYDGPAIIISGNGAYTGRTIFYKGKFDLYQRTYACTIKNDKNIDLIYGLYIIIKEELVNKINGGTHGSAIPYIVKNDLAKFEIKYSENSITKFSKKAKPILENILNNQNQNENLEQLRDTLLPKLMNGEIDLDKIEV